MPKIDPENEYKLALALSILTRDSIARVIPPEVVRNTAMVLREMRFLYDRTRKRSWQRYLELKAKEPE